MSIFSSHLGVILRGWEFSLRGFVDLNVVVGSKSRAYFPVRLSLIIANCMNPKTTLGPKLETGCAFSGNHRYNSVVGRNLSAHKIEYDLVVVFLWESFEMFV